MAAYKVTIPVTVIVDITPEHVDADHRPLLNGDTAIVAVRRAVGALFGSPAEMRKRLGVHRLFIHGRWENFPVEPTTLVTGGMATPAQRAPRVKRQVRRRVVKVRGRLGRAR